LQFTVLCDMATRVAPFVVASASGKATSDEAVLREAVGALTTDGASRATTQVAIERMTETLCRRLKDDIDGCAGFRLVPVLRAGAAMWPVANRLMGMPETRFVVGRRDPRTHTVDLRWTSSSTDWGAGAVVLDPILARGDTLTAVCRTLYEMGAPAVSALVCYAAPQGILRLRREFRASDLRLRVAVAGTGLTGDGFVLPITHGDMGDKLFETTR